MKRLFTIAVFFILSLLLTIAGALTPLTAEEVNKISEDMEKTRENILNTGTFGGTAYIFGNNFILCLLFFIPIAGPLFGFYVLYSTGVVIAAESLKMGGPPLLSFFLLFIFPFTWLEFLAYSTALAQSVWLTWRIIKHRGVRELVNTCVMIAVCAVILAVAALIEMFFIGVFGSLV